jgi:hypothetical protein
MVKIWIEMLSKLLEFSISFVNVKEISNTEKVKNCWTVGTSASWLPALCLML